MGVLCAKGISAYSTHPAVANRLPQRLVCKVGSRQWTSAVVTMMAMAEHCYIISASSGQKLTPCEEGEQASQVSPQ